MKLQLLIGLGLVVSWEAYGQKIPKIEGTDTLKAHEKKIDEVVITALGIKKEKKAIGYAVQEVKGDVFEKAKEPNFINSLSGRVAGLNIKNSTDLFQDPGINLRGAKPLIVIDGVPDRTADLWRVNADDVDNISVLKGPTASALYGSVGKDGAIMITTKKGKKGKMTVSFNNSTMFQTSFIRIPKVQTVYGAGNNGKYAYINGEGSGSEGGGWIWGPKLDQKDPTTPSGYFETPQYNSPVDPVTGKLVPLPWISRGKDNIKNFFDTGIIQSNNVSVDWGSEKATFRLSFSNIYQKGIVPNTNLKTTSISLAGSVNPIKDLMINSTLTYNKEYTSNFPEVGYGPTNYLYNLVLWTGADVDIRDLRNYWVAGKEGYQQRHYNVSYYNNPYFQAYEYLRPYYKDNILGNVNVEYKIVPNLSAKARVGANIYSLNREFREPKSYIGYGNKSLGNYTQVNGNYFDITSELGLKYQNHYSDNFTLSGEMYVSNYYRELKNSEIRTDGLVTPGWYNLFNSIGPLFAPTDGSRNRKEYEQINSVYGYVDMEFYKTFFLNMTARYDKVSTLPKGNNEYFYPSISGSLLLNQLLNLPAWINFAKLRGSFAQVSTGKIADDTYGYITAFEKSNINWNGQSSFYFGDKLINGNIKPETVDSWEVGTNLGFLKNRISLDVAYYQTSDYNNLAKIPLSEGVGYKYYLTNGNKYERKGIEITLNGDIIKHSNFTWSSQLNLSRYRKYLKEGYGGRDYAMVYNPANGRENYVKVGERMDKLTAMPYETSPDGQLVLKNGYPVNSTAPFESKMGYSDPDWTYGFSHNFSYRNFSLSLLFDGRIGGTMYSTTNQKMWWGGIAPGTVNQYRDDANAGHNTYVAPGVRVVSGSITYDQNGNVKSDTRVFVPNDVAVNYNGYMQTTSNAFESNYHYYKQTFIKLREVTLTYNFEKSFAKKLNLSSASISLIGRNLWLASAIKNVDPDSGMDQLQTPATRSFGVNINMKF
ncbi:SusC/RagA family TonB-linked outer membrane protein [Chryseobacterium sp. Tr-659]|uniref:SusC/RagA family TonB-linked outer membrane protein n=1 Tax=Chryseobacterium sp. Tr-659 TaxID=2608340 RepID=UPI001422D116|nr:SusC/RagA family TonB-linked outer membrane protein [Chryseobacterium sp. Tr-659]NIF06903.1 SusC/RagA family TonB-linked outer membrane protein [Chryseobacterium sp. Tr-659]